MNTLPAGRYFIGDPSLALTPELYDELLELVDGAEEQLVEIKDHQVWFANTGIDECTLVDRKGQAFEIVSGMLGAIPAELLDEEDKSFEDYGVIVDFKRVFQCSVGYGVVDIAKFSIKTDLSEIDEDDGDGDDYEELSF